jgi:hypothetical protein
MSHHTPSRQALALVAVGSLLHGPFVELAWAVQATSQKPATATEAKPATAPPQPKPSPSTASVAPAKPGTAQAAPVDGGWPRVYDVAGGASILVYQPQISSWDKQQHLVALAAVSYRDQTTTKPLLGTVKIEADTKVSLDERLVSFSAMKLTEANFASMAKDRVAAITAAIDKAMTGDDRVIALDRVLANLDKSGIVPRNVEGVKADPPAIFFSTTPALIVNLDGEPIWSPIKDNDLKYAVNTNWDLFEHGPTKTVFLRNEGTWLKASDVKGPWTPAGTLPDSFKKLPAEENFKEVKANLPGTPLKTAPQVFVTFTPGELILTTGAPSYLLVPGTKLLWVSNTESDVFRLGKTGPVYYLVAGRWFSAPDFKGPWTFATQSLPEDFKQISLEHERSRVLASVPGTDQAAEAVLLAQIPQTARVKKSEVKAPEVAYHGDKASFQPIEKTPVQRAVNTDKDVFQVEGKYYMCYQGVWFTSAASTGPWTLAESVPEAIYQIPASSPSHHVTYVTVEDDDDDEWVTYAAAAGYTGMMVAWGCAVWGTGWYYPPYWGYGGFYPYYYPHFPTYGYSAWYNPRTGAYGRSARVYGPYGGAGIGARYNPRTGTYSRGAAAWGPYGARGAATAYNPRTGAVGATRQGSNVYGSWGSTAVQRGDDWAVTNRYTNNRTGNTTRTIRTDEGSAITRRGDQGGRVGVGDEGNVYAGKDGNVYRRQDGTWQKYDDGNWSNTDRQPTRPNPQDRSTTADRPATQQATPTDRGTVDQLNRDSAARREGTQRTNDYGSYRGGSSSPRSTGSYRGGGASRGGARGGGRRR